MTLAHGKGLAAANGKALEADQLGSSINSENSHRRTHRQPACHICAQQLDRPGICHDFGREITRDAFAAYRVACVTDSDLDIARKDHRRAVVRVMSAPLPRLDRRVFATSRLAEFTSVKELTAQTGHTPDQWLLVIFKELVDNALDEAERAGVPPEIEIEVDKGQITITDKGGGIEPETVAKILDYTVRASDKEAYVSPTRGAQGNALKTILAMPFALDGATGRTTIESRGICHEIVFSIDPIRREPKIQHTTGPSVVKNGTKITVHLTASPWSEETYVEAQFLQIASDFAALNPHLSIMHQPASDQTWSKWTPADPIPAHWYSADRFDRLIAAHLAHDQDHDSTTTVREFVATFRGMSATAKQKTILETTGTARMTLSDFYDEGRNKAGVHQLLVAMQEATKPVKPADLGVIGRDHISSHFVQMGAEMKTFEYGKQTGETSAGLPFVVEAAFAWRPLSEMRQLITGLNFSPGLSNPFRNLGGDFELSLDQVLSSQRASITDPIVMLVHLTCPVMAFTDRGKGQLVVDDMTGAAIETAVKTVTKKWCCARKQEERDATAVKRRAARLIRSRETSIKDAAYEVMEEAWLKASAGGTLPAKPRQIMYAARPKIQEITGKQLDDKYFTQTLLPDYVAEHGGDWDVAWDDRGHFVEPHAGEVIGLGTLSVRKYLAGLRAPRIDTGKFTGTTISTYGPKGNYGAVLYIEKEGFGPLLDRVDLANRFDIAIMSCKGTSVTAARQLTEKVCGERGIPLFILHDFDKSGFSIKATLHQDTRRYQFKDKVQAVDLGLRLADVIELGLEDLAEDVFDTGSEESREENLRQNSATDEEVEFLLDRRVELNALTSNQLVKFIERKLTEHGVHKVVPPADTLAKAYRSNIRTAKIKEIVERAIQEMGDGDIIDVPDDLPEQVAEVLRDNPSLRWDEAVEAIADEGSDQ
jgi:DNA topoisomerase VI subunit B